MKENSIEEDIKIIKSLDTLDDIELKNAIEHILSDYRRVLKENEIYKKNSEIMSKENLSTAEQLKVEIKENFRLKNQLENNRKEYQETYKDVRKELKELKKENEELRKELNEENKKCMMLAVEKQDYFEKYKYHLQQNESLTRKFSNDIPVQEVKDKIEELKEQYNVRELDFIKTTQDIRKIIIQSLEELIEGKN